MTDKVQKIREAVENRYEYWRKKESNSHSIESEIRMSECQHLLLMLDSLQEEPVSEDLEEEIQKTIHNHFFDLNGIAIAGTSVYATVDDMVYIAKHFANWQKEQMMKDAIDAELDDVCGFLTISIPYHNGIAGDKVKVIIIKSE